MRPVRGATPARRVPGTPARAPSQESLNGDSEKVAVYCRIRPIASDEEESCARLDGDNVVVLTPPETSRAAKTGKESHYTFTRAFGEDAGQRDIFESIGFPLVKDLVTARNSLLFMYGVTGSGKTHTMQGNHHDGVIGRTFDVLFNSLGNRLVSMKRLIVPDGFNGYTVQDSAQAFKDLQDEMIENRSRRNRRGGNDHGNLSDRIPDESFVSDLDSKAVYAVFISYVQVYNERIYDLLENDPREIERPKDLRADSLEWQYVHNGVEVPVESAIEALQVFKKGQEHRKVADTKLNAQSSRSHSILTIRLVKAQPGGDGEINTAAPIDVSQLSLVDMAGSERATRTGNTREKLAEASRINNSLTTLRRCINQLRENQRRGRRDHIPYRDSQITKMFGSFFDGKPGCGTLRMMVCINPGPKDFDENLNVMEFAEATQKIQIERIEPIQRELYTPGRLRGHEAYREALKRVIDTPTSKLPSQSSSGYSPIYSLGPDWPPLDINHLEDEETLDNLERFLTNRLATRNNLVEDYAVQIKKFRDRLVDLEQDNILLREENYRLKGGNDGERRRIKDLETRLVNAEAANGSLRRKNTALEETKKELERELDDKELQINAKKKEQHRSTRRLKTQLSQQEALSSELAQRLQEEKEEKNDILYDKAKLRAVRRLVNVDGRGRAMNKTISDPDVSVATLDRENQWNRKPLSSAKSNQDVSRNPIPTPRRSVAVSNPRYRRSRSAGVMVDHQAANAVPTNTIMQPSNLKKKRSVTKLSERDLLDPKTSNYALTTQEQDSDGDIVTTIYKADVNPTCSGGRQVIINDIETLTQKSPEKSPVVRTRRSKRSFEEAEAASVGSRVAAFEHKLGSAKKYRFR